MAQDPNEPRLSRMSLNSLKQKLDADRAKHEQFKANVEDRMEDEKKNRPKTVSPAWIGVIVGVALLAVLLILYLFPPAALQEWGVGVDLSDQEYDIPGMWDAGGHVIDAGPPDTGPEETTMRRRRRRATPMTEETTEMTAMEPTGVSAEDDPLGGIL